MSITVYGFWRSIASFRVRVALKLKGLPFEEIPIDILSGEQFQPEYAAVSAERVVPTFIHDGHSIFQSLAIIEYLETLQPEPRLIPSDAKEKAYAKSLALVTVADAHPLVTPRVRNHLAATYERLLAQRPATPFALGANPGLADICIAGQVVTAQYVKLGLDDFPEVKRLAEHCFKLPAFATSHPYEQPGYKAANTAH
jgi:glutathione S-transferase